MCDMTLSYMRPDPFTHSRPTRVLHRCTHAHNAHVSCALGGMQREKQQWVF